MPTNAKVLSDLFQRDLKRLCVEIEAIPENKLWERLPGITNSCGVLAQHLVGNLRHFIEASLGETGYLREREREFTNTGRPKEELVQDVKVLIKEVEAVLIEQTNGELEAEFPQQFPFETTVQEALIHLYGHLNYHLGQINYLRRMITEKG